MERRTVAGNMSAWLVVALLGAAWQTGTAGEDPRGRAGEGLIGPMRPLTIAITNPGAASVETIDATMSLQGSAFSAAGIAAVSWQSSRGPRGTATGAASWATGIIPLALGPNAITVTAYDRAGNSASDSITVLRESRAPQPVTLNWMAPTRRVDGTPLTGLAGYEIHYGRMPGTYDYHVRIDNPGLSRYVLGNLSPGDWYFSMTAFDRDGTESGYSNEVIKRVQ